MVARKPKMVVIDGIRYRSDEVPKPAKVVPVVAEVEDTTGTEPTSFLSTTGTVPVSTAEEPTETESAGAVPADGVVVETEEEVTEVTEKPTEATEPKKAAAAKKAAPAARNKARQPDETGGAGASQGVETK